MSVKLVCSVCGSDDIVYAHESADPARAFVRQRSVDDRWPMAKCNGHTDKRNPWTPVISERAFQKRQRIASVPPMDLFGSLPDDERAALARPIKV